MFVFQNFANIRKLYTLRKTFTSTNLSFILIKNISDHPKKFVTFDEVIAQRRAEAKRSLVVQVNSDSSFNELYGYCSKYADVNGVHHYKNGSDEHFMLIEFATENDLNNIITSCCGYQKTNDVLPPKSPFVWFKAVKGKKEKFTVPNNVLLLSKNGNHIISNDELCQKLATCDSVSHQIETLYDNTILNDLGTRLRYIVARQIEMLLGSMHSDLIVHLFGSSVNGFGKRDCDLDLVLTNCVSNKSTTDPRLIFHCVPTGGWPRSLESAAAALEWRGAGAGRLQRVLHAREPSKSEHRLIFHCVQNGGWPRSLESAAAALEWRGVGAGRLQRVLHARVPILKYKHELAGLHVDLCAGNMSGVYMSELLWQLSSLDPRVSRLTLTVRRWAQSVGLTNAHPGRWITNFPLTLLVIFFLQHRKDPVLPSFKTLVKHADKTDTRLAEENLNCTFLRDMNRLPPRTYGQNDDSLEKLLLQFFEYYAQFDFNEKGISVVEGAPIRKPNGQPLYIVNPLEQSLNVSKNVSFEELERIKLEVRNAAWHLEQDLDSKSEDWGLLGLVEQKTSRGLKKLLRVGNSHRLVSVKDLFNPDEETELAVKSKLLQDKEKTENKDVKNEPKYKNSSVAAAVHKIQRQKWT